VQQEVGASHSSDSAAGAASGAGAAKVVVGAKREKEKAASSSSSSSEHESKDEVEAEVGPKGELAALAAKEVALVNDPQSHAEALRVSIQVLSLLA